jgi:hypothetical protein
MVPLELRIVSYSGLLVDSNLGNWNLIYLVQDSG